MNKIIGATLCLPITFTVYASPQSQQISLLQKLIKQQQQQLAKQSAQIKQLSIRLTQLEQHKKSHTKTVSLDIKDKPSKVGAIPSRHFVFGTNKANLSLYGHISALTFYANDGKEGHVFYATDRASNSRISADSLLKPTENLTLGSHIQLGFDVNESNIVSQTSPSPTPSIDIRRAEFFTQSKYFGEILIGKGETASDNTAYADLSGTQLAGRSSQNDIGGGLFYRNKATGNLSTTSVGATVNGLDGFSRRNRIRYNTPSFAGFKLEGSVIEGDRQDVALKFARVIGHTKLAAQVALTSTQVFNAGSVNVASGNELNGSASILLPIGISLTGAGGEVMAKEANRDKPYYYYSKVGYQKKFFNLGITALSVDGGRYFNFAQNNDRATGYGVQALQNINAWDMAAFLAYRHFALHRPSSAFYGLNLAIAGIMYQF